MRTFIVLLCLIALCYADPLKSMSKNCRLETFLTPGYEYRMIFEAFIYKFEMQFRFNKDPSTSDHYFEILYAKKGFEDVTERFRKHGGNHIKYKINKASECAQGDKWFIWEVYGDFITYLNRKKLVGVPEILFATLYPSKEDTHFLTRFKVRLGWIDKQFEARLIHIPKTMFIGQ